MEKEGVELEESEEEETEEDAVKLEEEGLLLIYPVTIY